MLESMPLELSRPLEMKSHASAIINQSYKARRSSQVHSASTPLSLSSGCAHRASDTNGLAANAEHTEHTDAGTQSHSMEPLATGATMVSRPMDGAVEPRALPENPNSEGVAAPDMARQEHTSPAVIKVATRQRPSTPPSTSPLSPPPLSSSPRPPPLPPPPSPPSPNLASFPHSMKGHPSSPLVGKRNTSLSRPPSSAATLRRAQTIHGFAHGASSPLSPNSQRAPLGHSASPGSSPHRGSPRSISLQDWIAARKAGGKPISASVGASPMRGYPRSVSLADWIATKKANGSSPLAAGRVTQENPCLSAWGANTRVLDHATHPAVEQEAVSSGEEDCHFIPEPIVPVVPTHVAKWFHELEKRGAHGPSAMSSSHVFHCRVVEAE